MILNDYHHYYYLTLTPSDLLLDTGRHFPSIDKGTLEKSGLAHSSSSRKGHSENKLDFHLYFQALDGEEVKLWLPHTVSPQSKAQHNA